MRRTLILLFATLVFAALVPITYNLGEELARRSGDLDGIYSLGGFFLAMVFIAATISCLIGTLVSILFDINDIIIERD
jgi:hypothetical protein